MDSKRYSPLDLKNMLTKILISEKGKSKIDFSVEGISVAYGYNCLHMSPFGIHVEFTLKQIYLPGLYFSTQNNKFFFVWHPDNHQEVNILQPRGHMEGTSFSPNNFYIHPKHLSVDGMKIMK